jgi:predicted DNA-binding transcriptional regulator AlpA
MPLKPVEKCTPHGPRRRRSSTRQTKVTPTLTHQRQGGRESDIDEPAPRRFLTAPQVHERYNISDMSLWRWLEDRDLGFPEPELIIQRRRYWLESDLLAWERARNAPRAASPEREIADA